MGGPLILAIDPGYVQSGWVTFQDNRVVNSGITENGAVLCKIYEGAFEILAIETITSYGMSVGREVFETCVWIGRFMQMYRTPNLVKLVSRRDVKTWLCGTPTAKDANVRAALLEIFPATGGGSIKQIGNKKLPGPLYGISGDKWAALALAVMVKTSVEKEHESKLVKRGIE